MNTMLVFLACCVCAVFAAVWQERRNPKAGDGMCISFSYPEMGKLKVGEIKNVPKKCVSVTCNKDGHVTGTGCIKIGVPEGCTLENTDYSKPHPECCPKNFTCHAEATELV